MKGPFTALERPALFDEAAARWIAYGELESRVADVAARFASSPRGLAFLLCPVRPTSIIMYLALLRAGHVVALLDPATSGAHLDALRAAYLPEWVIAGQDAGAREQVEDFFVQASGPAERAPLHPDLAVLLSTSGSTGSPKFVRLSAQALAANAASIAEALHLNPAERAMAYQGLHYAYGLSVVNSHLHAGASLLLTSKTVLERSFWEQAAQENCTSFAGVPYTYEMLRRLGPGLWGQPSLTTMTQAGGRLKPALVAWFHEVLVGMGKRFVPMYGQTEATARIAIMPPDALPAKVGAVGRAVPGGRLEIAPLNGQPGPEGEIIYTGANVMMGYAACRDDLARGDECQGRLATGDVGHLDEEGFLYVTGRLKRIAKLFGLRLNLDEVEDRLRHRGPVAALEHRERLVVFCEFGDALSLQALGRELAADLKVHHSALRLQRVEALPLLASGKVDYQRLREEA